MPRRTLIGHLLNRAPVDLRPRRGLLQTATAEVSGHDLEQMGKVSTVFSVVDGISEAVGAARWRLWRGDSIDDPDRIEVTRHAALTVWDKPNPFQTTPEFVETAQQYYELTGEYWWVVSNQIGGRAVSFPLELWNIRPDRIAPVPHPTDFISGYEYTGHQGDKVPLSLDQVIWNKRPNPLTPYRGLSPLGSLIHDTQGDVAAARYNNLFFANGADPGGIIEALNPIGDDEFDLLIARWRESHRGIANAHRVGYLENAKFVPTQYTRRDMQFVDLRSFSREVVREAWRFPRSMMGSEAASNRATHEAELVFFNNMLVKPRLRKLRSSLNDDFLPKFPNVGRSSTRRLWFDFDDPSPDDRENQRADLDSAVANAVALIGIGATPDSTVEAFDLPDIEFDDDRLPMNNPEPAAPPQVVEDPEEEEAPNPDEEDEEE